MVQNIKTNEDELLDFLKIIFQENPNLGELYID